MRTKFTLKIPAFPYDESSRKEGSTNFSIVGIKKTYFSETCFQIDTFLSFEKTKHPCNTILSLSLQNDRACSTSG
jgi:hypothetical protein